MNINFMQIKKLSRERHNQKRIEAQPIGSAIKFKRTAMHMTLEEGSESICSVSYLSKLENSQIELSEQFTKPLLERFGLEHYYDEQIDNDYDKDLQNLARHFIDQNKPKDEILTRYQNRLDYQSILIHMIYHTLHGNVDQSMAQYQNLKIYIPNLSDIEFSMFMICISIHLFSKSKHRLAFDLLMLTPNYKDLSEDLNLIILKWRLMNAFKMQRMSEVMSMYPVYLNKLIDLGYYHLLHEIRSAYVQFEAYFKQPSEIQKHLDKMNGLKTNERDYALAKSFFFHQRYHESARISEKYYRENCEWLTIHMLALDYEHKTDEINAILNNRQTLSINCDSANILLNHLKYKYQGDKKMLLSYLRREILGVKHLTDEYYLLDYLMVDSLKLFSGHQFYKEASLVFSKYWMRLKDLNISDELGLEPKGD